MTDLEVGKLVAILVAAYPSAPVESATRNVYKLGLSDLDVAAATEAVERLIKTAKWMPTVAEIRAAASEVRRGPKRLGAEAWGDACLAIRLVGSYSAAPTFKDPLVAEAVRLLGWRNLCLGDNDAADRARFIELYDGLAERQRVDQVAGRALPAPEAARGGLPWGPPERKALPPANPVAELTAGLLRPMRPVTTEDR